MSNQRLYLVHKPTGAKVLLLKDFDGWLSKSGCEEQIDDWLDQDSERKYAPGEHFTLEVTT